MSSNTKCTSSSISLDWSTHELADDHEIDGYTVKYRIKGTKPFEIKQINDPSANSVFLDGLKSDTHYEIKVYGSVDGDDTLLFEKKERTEKNMSGSLLSISKKKDNKSNYLDIYQIVPESIQNLAKNVRRCDMCKSLNHLSGPL